MTYSSEVLADGPAVYWRLGETTGTTIGDSSGNSRNGTWNAPPSRTASLLTSDTADGSAGLNGSTQYGSVVYDAGLNAPTALTLEAWVKSTASGSGFNYAILDRDVLSNRVWQFRMSSSGKLEFITIGGSMGVVTATSVRSINDGARHHVAVTFDGSNVRLYIDGTLDKTQAASGSFTANTTRLAIGVNNSGQGNASVGQFVGTIDEAAYYTKTLSATRIAAHYAAGTAVQPQQGSATFSAATSASLAGQVATAPQQGAAQLSAATSAALAVADLTFGEAAFGASTFAALFDGGQFTQASPYWLLGTSGVVEVPATPDRPSDGPWFHFEPTFSGSLTMEVTSPIIDSIFTVYDADFDEVQVDDDGELSVVLDAGEPIWIWLETAEAGQLEVSWTYAERASSQITVTLERDRISETPSTLAVNVGNGAPEDAVTFSIFGPTTVEDFTTATMSRTGDLDDFPIQLPALDQGDYVLRVETVLTGTEEVPFTVLDDALVWGGTDDTNPVPPVVDVQRWTFYDVRDHSDTWTLQRNPSSWSNMLPPNDFTHAATVAVDGQILTWQAGARPWRMEFKGWIDDEDEYNRFVRWSNLRRRLWLIDHRNRPWLVTLEHFDANHVIKVGLPWAHEYTVRAVIFKQGWS